MLSFIAASTALALAPGPDNLFVLTQSMLHGRRVGLLVTLGLCTGLVGHTAAVACGVAALFKTSPLAFIGLKSIGSAYLLYVAHQAWRAGRRAARSRPQAPQLSPWQLYQRGVIMNITNPKVTIFFLAFLPQFVVINNGAVASQIALLGALFIITTIVVFGTIAILAGTIGAWLGDSPRAMRYLNYAACMVLVTLALKLFTSPFFPQ